jgi:hypothetical protein
LFSEGVDLLDVGGIGGILPFVFSPGNAISSEQFWVELIPSPHDDGDGEFAGCRFCGCDVESWLLAAGQQLAWLCGEAQCFFAGGHGISPQGSDVDEMP